MVGLVGWAAASRLPLTPPLGLLQVNLGYLCQACTSLLHSRKMLQHYLQVTEPLSAAAAWTASPLASVGSSHLLSPPQNKNGEGIPSAVAPRAQRPPTAAPSCSSSKQPTPDTEASEQRALHTVQYGLLKILSRTLAALRHFTPDVCQILLDQVYQPPVPPASSGAVKALLCPALHQELPGPSGALHRSRLALPCSPWTLLNTTSCLP